MQAGLAASGPLIPQSDKIASMAQPDIDALFAETLLGDYDDKPWDAVQSLRRIRTPEVFNKAAAWTESVEPLERARGLDVIAQLGKRRSIRRIISRENPTISWLRSCNGNEKCGRSTPRSRP